jgi:heme/copper-type cytochrome/quinol oxidase subunit 2
VTFLDPSFGPSPAPFSVVAAQGWKHWWLPEQLSMHGDAMDNLFLWIFWITTIIFFMVEIALVVFLIKYRDRGDGRRATFTHGNTRLEMAWTLAPAVILIVIALATKRVWDNYRYSPDAKDPARAQILVVGEQFKWNFVFPGPDEQLGRYLAFPRPTDAPYRAMPRAKALAEIGKHINDTNPLGQYLDKANPADPAADDDYARNPGRPLIVPSGRAIDLNLTSKDVLHDFFLPTFRVKLDAVPGLRGHIVFRGKPQAQSTKRMPLEQVPADKGIWLDPDTKLVQAGGNPRRYQIPDPSAKVPAGRPRPVILATGESLNDGARRRLSRAGVSLEEMNSNPQRVAEEVEKFRADLKALGLTELSVVMKPHEIVCEELCGLGHATMRGEMVMVTPQEYRHYLNLTARPTPATPTKPAQPAVSDAGTNAGAGGGDAVVATAAAAKD